MIKTALFPVAGLAGAFQPATKTVPKELLPVLDAPLIQYALDEAVAAGCTRFVFVMRPGQDALRRHFERDEALEHALRAAGKPAAADAARRAALGADTVSYIVQEEPKGLGHAVALARDAIGDAPFAVLLPDDLIDAEPTALEQMMAQERAASAALVAGIEVPREQVASYGIMRVEDTGGSLLRVKSLEEKPEGGDTRSNFSVVGRYLLPPEIFAALEATPPDASGALQLTDALARLAAEGRVSAFRFEGERFDCGSLQGYLRASLALAMKRPDARADLATYMRRLLDRERRGW